jgi:hypothetical protein
VASASGFACLPVTSKEKLPPGLTLAEDGTLSGTVGQGDTGTYSFLVAVHDGQGRRDLRSLAITLRPPVVQGQGGCSLVGLGAPSLLLSLLALAGIRRKKAAP